MKVTFPAMRGEMGGRTYYSCLLKMNAIPRMFTFTDWAEFTPEQREQRELNKKRIPDITRYIIENEESYLFSSITASYKCDVDFKPTKENPMLGVLEMDFDSAHFVINDGQHRCAAIAAAMKENPAMADESISVLLFPYENLDRVQQMFSDLNRFVAKTSRSLDILYDKRDPLSRLTLKMCETVPVFKDLVDKDATSLPARSPKLFTLTALYDATKELLGSVDENSEDTFSTENLDKATAFWNEVAEVIPDWNKVKDERMRSIDLRQSSISAHSVVLRAIGAIGHEIMASEDWADVLAGLRGVNWRKDNPGWENVCIIANSVVSNRQARVATRAYLKEQLGLPLTDVERRARGQRED